jgi:hypothetical protein
MAHLHFRRLLAVFVVAVGLAAACSRKDQAHERPVVPEAEMEGVVAAEWGNGDQQVGRNIPQEAAPEGPKSFVVDAKGRIYVLDALNHRALGYEAGKQVSTTTLPERPFVDIELDGTSGFALLDIDSTPGIVFVGFDGTVAGEIPIGLEGEIPEPNVITALVSADDGWYVEVEGDYLVRIADTVPQAVEEAAVAGQVVANGEVVRIDTVDDGRFSIVKQDVAGEDEPTALAEIGFDQALAERTLFALRAGGGYVVAVQLFIPDDDPEKTGTSRHELVLLSAEGGETKRLLLPRAGGDEDSFRSVKLGRDGNIYVMTFSDTGADIGKVVLP